MATEELLQFSVASMVENVLQQHGKRLYDIDLASRKAEEAALRRNEAAGWLRKTVGVVGGKDLPAQPSEEEFLQGLRSGIILCNVLNKVQPGAVQKVIEAPSDTVIIPDGAALSAYQYFENVRNFLVAIEDMGLPTFEASDLEQGGKTSRVVNCVLALKSYSDWKHGGGIGLWKFGSVKATASGKQFVLKNSEPFMNSISRTSSSEKSLERSASEQLLLNDFGSENGEMGNLSLNTFVRGVLSDKRQEEIPMVVENILSKLMEEFERRLATQSNQVNAPCSNGSLTPIKSPCSNGTLTQTSAAEMEICTPSTTYEENGPREINTEENMHTVYNNGNLNTQIQRQLFLVEKQHGEIQVLKSTMLLTKADLKNLQMKYNEEINYLGAHLRSLAHAASGYQRVLEENRKLYNQVQDLKGNIRVYCRVRPLHGQVRGFGSVEHLDEGSITITTPSKYGKEGKKSFTFNRVFGPSASQEEVFSDTQPLIRSVLDGFNVCIFAYGQTGSGKTHTMSGPDVLTPETMGVNYRALNDLFLISEQRKDIFLYDVSVQMIEIYNEQKNRAVGSTAMNDRSSRSHSCLTVHVQGRDLASGAVLRGCMHLVDLAGSERVDKSEAVGERLKEAQHINKSLSALGDVIASLAQKNSHVPYRNSKLTQLLQDSLGGQAKTLMFVHISPEYDAIGETLSTLKFAERVSSVELGAARANKETAEVKDLKEQIANLKAALAKKDGEAMRTPNSLSTMSSAGSSPSRYSWQSLNISSDNLEMKNSSSKPKRRSLDLQDLLLSPPWPNVGSSPGSKDYEKEAINGDWVDKVMVNKQDGDRRDSLGSWEDDASTRQSPDTFYQKLNGRNQVVTDDSDELEATTSDSSEQDFHWQSNNAQKASSIPNGIGSKLKRPSLKHARTMEIKSSIPPPPTRRLSTSPSLPKLTGRQAFSADGKRKPLSGK
ncbi:OLC1v1001965C4 [Oldenlandia corymbosa var. corymbosa]|uniref:OLC1v1001965C4 n=1 Tax=Oldenlandia corymbosa var. corymbosa TaxID=529605 RepID=A0AAV1D784_OLDCO|nr:OLC1v1001965C4 [Oldenlandia corymbosa var. corymbosa]